MNINHLILNLTDNCNLQCKYCFVQQSNNYMSLDIAKKAINFILKQNNNYNKIITFFGGEPILCYESIIKPIVEYCNEKYKNIFKFNITTNGTLLDEEKLIFFKKNNFNLLLSMDGNKIVQNYNRPHKNIEISSFDLIEKNFNLILQYYPNIEIRGTIYPDTCQYLFESFYFFIKNNFKNIYFMPDNFSNWPKKNIDILKNELNKISNYYIQCFLNNIIPYSFLPYNEILKIIESFYLNINTKIQKDCNFQCGLGNKAITIDYLGNIYTCQMVSSINNNLYLIGNINDNIINNQNLLNNFLKEKIVQCEDKNFCNNNCKIKNYCLKNFCHVNSYLQFNNLNTKSLIQCQWENQIFLESLNIYNNLKNNILFLNYYKLKGEKIIYE